MVAVKPLLLLVSGLGLVRSQGVGANLDPCPQKCVNDVFNQGVGCAGGDTACICAKPEFGFGVRDCALGACAGLVAQATNFVQTFCATATLGTTAAAGAPAPVTTSSSTAGDRPTLSSAPQSSVTPTTSTEAPSEVVASQSSPTAAASDKPEESSDQDENDNGEGEDEDEDEDEEDADEEQGGLSVGAQAGIGATVAVVGLGFIGLAFWLLRRSRSRNSISTGNFHISGPMPGSGRDYADSHLDFKEGNTSELELRSRRYEDMLPRQQPASMI